MESRDRLLFPELENLLPLQQLKIASFREFSRQQVGFQGKPRILDDNSQPGSLAERIRRQTGSRSEIVFEALPEDDPQRRCPDISKARRLLGWEPRVGLDEGLAPTVEYFRSLEAAVA